MSRAHKTVYLYGRLQDSHGWVWRQARTHHPDYYIGDNSKSVEYSFENELKVWAGFHLNEFKQYQLNHIVLGANMKTIQYAFDDITGLTWSQ